MLEKISVKTILIVVIVMFSFFVVCEYASAKNVYFSNQEKYEDTISLANLSKNEIIDLYQEKYFKIIKRNNVLLNNEDADELNNDRKELEDLFNEVENRITNKNYLKKYKKIQKKFSKCDEITTIGINECAQKNYDAADNLLNRTYKKAKKKLNSHESKKLTQSEKNGKKKLKIIKKYMTQWNLELLGIAYTMATESTCQNSELCY